MDPISAGAAKHLQQNVFEQAEQQIQKSNQSISDFENLRQKLEDQDAISNFQQNNQVNQSNNINQIQQTDQINQIDPSNSNLQVQRAGEVPDVSGVPDVKNLGQIESTINSIRSGQVRLNEIISQATSGRNFSPQELLGMQAEVARITEELQTATKVVEKLSEGVKTLLNMPL